jgi:tetratricopeptide (TPR) repeat protein
MKTVPFLSATISASFLVWMVSAEPNLAIAVESCARSVAGDHDRDCSPDRHRDRDDNSEHFRKLELLTLRQLNQSIHTHPNDPLLYLRKAFVLSELGDSIQALANYDRAISLNPNDPQGYFYRGNLRFEMGTASLALQDYARAISLNPNLPEVYVARAFIRAELGDESGAIADSNRARLLNLQDNGPRPPPIR